MNCNECGCEWPRHDDDCEEHRYQCGGCLEEVSGHQLRRVARAMRATGYSPDDGMMCAECFVDVLGDY